MAWAIAVKQFNAAIPGMQSSFSFTEFPCASFDHRDLRNFLGDTVGATLFKNLDLAERDMMKGARLLKNRIEIITEEQHRRLREVLDRSVLSVWLTTPIQ